MRVRVLVGVTYCMKCFALLWDSGLGTLIVDTLLCSLLHYCSRRFIGRKCCYLNLWHFSKACLHLKVRVYFVGL